jgi:hypothetical protein
MESFYFYLDYNTPLDPNLSQFHFQSNTNPSGSMCNGL